MEVKHGIHSCKSCPETIHSCLWHFFTEMSESDVRYYWHKLLIWEGTFKNLSNWSTNGKVIKKQKFSKSKYDLWHFYWLDCMFYWDDWWLPCNYKRRKAYSGGVHIFYRCVSLCFDIIHRPWFPFTADINMPLQVYKLHRHETAARHQNHF